MTTIPQKELRNQVGEVLRRAEAGETFTVTVAGRPVAELGPARGRRWVAGAALAEIWRGESPHDLDADLSRLGGAWATRSPDESAARHLGFDRGRRTGGR